MSDSESESTPVVKPTASVDNASLNETVVEPILDFSKRATQFIKGCDRPANQQFREIAVATLAGFIIMGACGFIVKLIHIPINQILVGN